MKSEKKKTRGIKLNQKKNTISVDDMIHSLPGKPMRTMIKLTQIVKQVDNLVWYEINK